METISNEALIDALEQRTEHQLAEAVRLFQNLDGQTLLKVPPGGGWSIAACFWHLNSYGDYYQPKLRECLEQTHQSAAPLYFKSGYLGRYFTGLMEPKTGMKRLKAAKIHQPPRLDQPHATVAEFICQLEELLQLLRMGYHRDLGRGRIRVSVMKYIRLKCGDLFSFLVAHNERHLLQAGRILDELSSTQKLPTGSTAVK